MISNIVEQRQMAELESACIQKDNEIQAWKNLCFKALNIAAGLTNHAYDNASVRKLEKELREAQRTYREMTRE